MQIAYLILAHNNPQQVGRLVNALVADGVSFHLHVDRRAPVQPYVEAAPAAAIVGQRVAVNWCGFSMVDATLRLLRQAHEAGADRFVLLSGADYPIVSNERIRAELTKDAEWIQVDRKLEASGNEYFDRCANRWFFGDVPAFNPRSGSQLSQRVARAVERRMPIRRHQLPVYYGSSWWALSRQAVSCILAADVEDPAIIRRFRFARSPDEMVFQTLVKASPRANRIAFDVTRGFTSPPKRAALHRVDWDNPNPAVPRVLDDEDSLDDLLASDALFARKLDSVRSAALLDQMDRARRV